MMVNMLFRKNQFKVKYDVDNNRENKRIKKLTSSAIVYYYVYWLMLLIFLLCYRFMVPTIDENNHSLLFYIYTIMTWIPLIVITALEVRLTIRYFCVNFREDWESIKINSGNSWLKIRLNFLNRLFEGKKYNDDPLLEILKNNLKSVYYLVIFLVISMPLLFFTVSQM